jgi:ATP-dependent Clp protease ATP-binding subunit ClpC
MGVHLAGEGIGFDTGARTDDRDSDVKRSALRAARKTFPQEFLNRFDATPVFKPLRHEHLNQILDNVVSRFHLRSLRGAAPFLLELTPAAKDWVIERGFSPRFGARPLRRLVEQKIVTPLSHFVIDGRIQRGDLILVDVGADGLRFLRHAADLPEAEAPGPLIAKPDPAAGKALTGGGEEEDITEEIQRVAARAQSAGLEDT